MNEDEELLREFIGKNYDKITTSSFNLAGFVWGSLYLFYRKMYLYAVILILIERLIFSFHTPILFQGLFFLIRIAVGFNVNKIYINYAKKQIEKNKGKNTPNKVSLKGGTVGLVGKLLISLYIVGMILSLIAGAFLIYFIYWMFTELRGLG